MEKDKDKVTIIIPVYNVSRYLSQCLQSICCQSYSNWEAILVDDGSTDESGTICNQFVEQDNRFVVVHQQNQGAANAKNTGLDYASGSYVTFLDSDDFVEAHWLELAVRELKTQRADIVEYCFCKEYTNHQEAVAYEPFRYGVFSAEQYLACYLQDWTCSLFWNKLFRVEVIREVRFHRERRCIDDEFFTYKALTFAKKIVVIEDVLYHYRQRASSAVASEKNRKQITDDALEILIERYEWICTYFPQLKKVYLRHDVDILFYFANQFLFTEQTAQKFSEARAFYIKRCLRERLDSGTIINAFRLLRYTKKQLLHHTTEVVQATNEDFFS